MEASQLSNREREMQLQRVNRDRNAQKNSGAGRLRWRCRAEMEMRRKTEKNSGTAGGTRRRIAGTTSQAAALFRGQWINLGEREVRVQRRCDFG